MANRRLYRRFRSFGSLRGAADVARVKILAQFGGVSIDADTEMLHPMDGAEFLGTEMWAIRSAHDANRLLNAIIGCEPNCAAIVAYREELATVRWGHPRRRLKPELRTVGSVMLTRVAARHPVHWVETGCFLPQDKFGKSVPHDGPVYGRHYWSNGNGWGKREG
jgi:hypothetical protein